MGNNEKGKSRDGRVNRKPLIGVIGFWEIVFFGAACLEAEGVYLVNDINSGFMNEPIKSLTSHRDRVFFTAADSRYGRELWVSDGHAEGREGFYRFPFFTTWTSQSLQVWTAG